jgi:cysteine-rich repeat protein
MMNQAPTNAFDRAPRRGAKSLCARTLVALGVLALVGGCDVFGSSKNTNGLTEGGIEEDGRAPRRRRPPGRIDPARRSPRHGRRRRRGRRHGRRGHHAVSVPRIDHLRDVDVHHRQRLRAHGRDGGHHLRRALGARVCVEGACLVRGCGDGFLEPAPMLPMLSTERCDDGNMVSGDGCSATCTIEQRTVAVDPTGESDVYIADGRQAIGIDGHGRALIVWALHEFSAQTSPGGPTFERVRLLARRYRANGAPEASDAASPLVLDANLIAIPPVATPAVAGLPDGGWVVAWTAFRSNTYDIVFRVIGANGAIGAERVANQTRTSVQKKPAVVALDSGFVIAWESANATQTDPDGGVYARRFTSAGVSNGNELAIMSATNDIQANVALASRGAAWIAVWTDQQLANDYIPSLRMRRFNAGGATETQQIAPFPPTSSQPFVIASGDGLRRRVSHDAHGCVGRHRTRLDS